MVQVDSVCGERPFPCSQTPSSCCVLMGPRDKLALWGLFYKNTNSIHDFITSQRPQILIPSPWVLRFGCTNLGGRHKGSDHNIRFNRSWCWMLSAWDVKSTEAQICSRGWSKRLLDQVPQDWKGMLEKQIPQGPYHPSLTCTFSWQGNT